MDQDPFARNETGRTSLFHAAERGDMEEVKRILSRLRGTGFGPPRLALLEITDAEGLTAADVAERHGHMEITELLRHERDRMDCFE